MGGDVVTERRRHSEIPARRGLRLLGRHAGVHPCEHELVGGRVRLEHPEVGDHGGRPASPEPEPPAVARAGPVPERGDEVETLDEPLARLADDDDHLGARGGDLGGAARARKADGRTSRTTSR